MNHNMKKRGLALLLACCCVFTAAPVAVKADNVSISTNQTPTGTYSSYTKAEGLKSDTVVYDTLSTSNNVHFYKYTAEKGGYFTVNLAQTSGKGKWNFSVYDADNGNQELETKPLASNYTSRIYNLRPGKSVYIKVERVKSTDITILDYQLTQDYQYSLQVKTTESAQWEQEDNDTPAAATSLQNGTWINGSSYKPLDVDWYEYTIPENGYFTYDFQGEGSSALWNLYLYDENMNELQKDTNTRTVSSGKYVLPVGAKVYVKVTCYGVGNQYKIRSNYYATEGWEKESNDTMALATDLTAGKTLHGSINSKKDVDYYRYVATGSGYFNFKFTNADGGNNQYWKLSVYDEKKKLLQTVETEDDLQISTAKLSFRKGKEIYLKVERNINDYACGHEYTVTVNQYKADNWEQESNDSFATATTVKKNKTCSANNYAVKDKDYFVYKAAKKGKVTIQVSLPDSGYWNVCVYNQKKKLVKQEDYAQTGQKFTVKAAKGQKLYVMVKARTKSAVGKTYRVTVKQK